MESQDTYYDRWEDYCINLLYRYGKEDEEDDEEEEEHQSLI